MLKQLTVCGHNKLWEIIKETGIPDHLNCLLRNLYARQEAKGRTRNGTINFTSVPQLCLTLFDPTDYSTPGFPVHHQHPEFAQTHVQGVGEAIQPSYPLSAPSPPAFSISQHQSLFKGFSFSRQVAKVLELQLQHQSFQ